MRNGVLLATTALALAAGPAWAQTSPQATDAGGIEEIIVTARQRAESLQSVPVAVAAMDGAMIERTFIPDVDSIERFMPNVELGRHPFTGGGMSASIRGISFGDLDRSFEPAVAVSVDGVFLASNTGAMMDTFDIDAVEVLRGPQGTLFGRNTIGGVISIKRTKPTMDWGLKGQITVGSYGVREYKAMANAPIIKDVLGLKIGGYRERSESFTRRASDGKREDGLDRYSLFGALRFNPSSAFDATLSIDHINDKSRYPSLVPLSAPGQTFCVAFGACIGTQGQRIEDSGYKLALDDYPFEARLKHTAVTLNAKLDVIDGVSIESITNYTKQKDALNVENTGGAPLANGAHIFVSLRDQKANQFSQEVRAVSDLGGAVDFVAGLYYMKSEFDLVQQAIVTGNRSQFFDAGQDLDAYAAYAEAYVEPIDKLRLTLGGRYTHEKKKFYIKFRNPTTGAITGQCPDATSAYAPCADPSVTFSKFTPRVTVDYRFTPDIMIYAGWSRGYRSGGWNSRATVTTAIGPYEPETVDSYEAGLRTTFWNNRARANVTVFRAKYKNKQEEVITASPINPLITQTQVQNAASATLQGVEGEFQLAPTRWLNLRAAVGYIDGKYDAFLSGGVDIRNQRNLRYAPKWSVSFGGDATIPVEATGGEILLNANYKWTDKFATSVIRDTTGLNRDFIDAYATVDASIGYRHELDDRKNVTLSAFVQNAFHSNGRLYRKVITGPFAFASREVARTWGLTLGFSY
ncbi:TonB-dependent receptor [Rhizorhabdus phycosphaerae]|uniref:TonB-dependent receptor n=1 Tax=Rhizorhabdus phycosphaerae TaxID=2711156 RepID=UPI0013EA9454|nr:TonB-dependent receptor [Rhizorhabdus phycosphaerae]